MRWIIRTGEWKDAALLARLIDRFAAGHPAAGVSRPAERIAPHYWSRLAAAGRTLTDHRRLASPRTPKYTMTVSVRLVSNRGPRDDTGQGPRPGNDMGPP